MGLLTTLGTGQGYLKAGFLGFPKSGKTYTATDLAIGAWHFFGKKGRIIFFDTEGGSEYIAHRVRAQCGMDLIGLRSRAFKDLMTVTKETEPDDILLADSITHVWRELMEAHRAQINRFRAQKNLPPRRKLEFQDFDALKSTWGNWTDWYLNSRVHCIICGRAGYEYEMELNEETGKKELIKGDTKMKVESEFGFEPSLLIEMERGPAPEHAHLAVVRGDRFGIIDGKTFTNPIFENFLPHLEMLKPGAHAPIDTSLKSDTGVDVDGDADWARERRQREILCEETQNYLIKIGLDGTAAEVKRKRVNALEGCFGTASKTAIESTNSERLREGLGKLRAMFDPPESREPEPPPEPEPPVLTPALEPVPTDQLTDEQRQIVDAQDRIEAATGKRPTEKAAKDWLKKQGR